MIEIVEKFLIGIILFIPGIYHSYLAVQALRGVDGFDFSNLTSFENEELFNNF